jgi:pimeloyl-ACP methyl ester carboxylesterase
MARRLYGMLASLVALALATLAAAGDAAAEPVQVKLGALRLNGNLEIASDTNLTEGVAIVVHGALGHHAEPTVAALQRTLKVRGIATLAITLSLGVDDRKGPRACEVPHAYGQGELAAEIERWVEWLAHHHVRRVDYIGWSRGGAQLVDFLQRQKGGRRVVLLAPTLLPAAEISAGYRKAHDKDLAIALEAARARPREQRRVDFLACRQAMVQGSTFLEAYRELPASSVASIVQQTLVVIAGNDEVVPDLETRLPATVKHVVIDGADHAFRDAAAEDAADAIAEFLRE